MTDTPPEIEPYTPQPEIQPDADFGQTPEIDPSDTPDELPPLMPDEGQK